MNSAVVDTNVLIAFLEKGSVESRVLARFDKLIVPAAVSYSLVQATDSSMPS